MTLHSCLTAGVLLAFTSCMIRTTAASWNYQKPSFFDFDSWWWNTPRGPQIFSCLTYLERNVRIDCEFPKTDKIPGPFCEFKQDGRLMGTTYPNNPVHLIPPVETRRRTNVTLVPPNICRLTWMPMSDNRAYTFTCRVYQGSTWKENSMAFNQRNLLICSAVNIVAYTAVWLLAAVVSFPVSAGLVTLWSAVPFSVFQKLSEIIFSVQWIASLSKAVRTCLWFAERKSKGHSMWSLHVLFLLYFTPCARCVITAMVLEPIFGHTWVWWSGNFNVFLFCPQKTQVEATQQRWMIWKKAARPFGI